MFSAPPPRLVGLVGLGLMGAAITARLRAAGFEVLGWDVSVERRGAHDWCAADAGEVFARCDRVLLSLPHLGVSGEVIDSVAVRPGQIVIDTTTGEPAQAVELAGRLKSFGATYIDAAVSGSSAQLRAGEAVVLAGGDLEAVARCDDLLSALARGTIHAGDSGNGAKLKLVTNLVLGLNRAALAEGLTLARSFGIDPKLALRALSEGAAYSRVMEAKGPKMLTGDFSPEARLSQHLKDVRLMLAAGGCLPLTETHRVLLERAEALGFGAADNSAIIKALE